MQLTKARVPLTLLTPLRTVQEGDELARDCFSPGGQKIAPEGQEIDESILRRLENNKVRHLWVSRVVPEWMPEVEAEFKDHETEATYSVSPLHYQIIVNLQGTFSTAGLIDLLDRLREDTELSGQTERFTGLVDRVEELEADENKIRSQIAERDQRQSFFEGLLQSARPQTINPSELSSEEATLGRRIQTFLQQLKRFTSEVCEFLLDCSEQVLDDLIELDQLDNYEETSNVHDSFVMFDRLYNLPRIDVEWTQKFATKSRDLMFDLFYRHELNESVLDEITDLAWSGGPRDFPHWILCLASPGDPEGYLLSHGINTALIVAGLSNSRGWEPNVERRQLVLASLTLDVGMALLPQAFHLHRDELSEDQRRTLKVHSLVSEDFLGDVCPVLTESRNLVEKHHERLRGQGYPRKSDTISEDLGLLIVSEVYDAMTSPRMWRNAIPPADTLDELESSAASEYPSAWVEELVREVGYYPVGTVVRLTNDQPAVVSSHNPAEPGNPEVLRIQDLMSGDTEEAFVVGEQDVGIQAGGTSLKAPGAIRQRLLGLYQGTSS